MSSPPIPPHTKSQFSMLTTTLGILRVLQDRDSLSSAPDYSQSHLQFVPLVGPGTVPNVEKWLRALDTIASCLSTGLPDEKIAVTATTNQRLSFLIAKSGKITPEDDDAVKEFCLLITSRASLEKTTALYVREHVFPFIIRRCRAALDQRIDSLLNLMLSFEWSLALRKFLCERKGSVEVVFPGSEEYRKRMIKKGRFATVEGMMRMLVEDIVDVCQSSIMNFGSGTTMDIDGPISVIQRQDQDEMDKQRNHNYHNLAHYCKVLRKSRFMGFLTSEATLFLDQELRKEAIKVQYALKRICEFVYEVRRLLIGARKFSLDGTVSYEWVGEDEVAKDPTPESVASSKGEPGTSSPHSQVEDAISRTFQQILIGHDRCQAEASNFLNKHPLLSDPSSYTGSPQVHPELKIFLHLITRRYPEFVDPSMYTPIGTEAAVCWCCAEWINTWIRNQDGQFKVMFTQLTNEVSKDWTFPTSFTYVLGQDHKLDATSWKVWRKLEQRLRLAITQASSTSPVKEDGMEAVEFESVVPEDFSSRHLVRPRSISLSNFEFQADPRMFSAQPFYTHPLDRWDTAKCSRLDASPSVLQVAANGQGKADDSVEDCTLDFGNPTLEILEPEDKRDEVFKKVVRWRSTLQVIDDFGKNDTKVNELDSTVTYLGVFG